MDKFAISSFNNNKIIYIQLLDLVLAYLHLYIYFYTKKVC